MEALGTTLVGLGPAILSIAHQIVLPLMPAEGPAAAAEGGREGGAVARRPGPGGRPGSSRGGSGREGKAAASALRKAAAPAGAMDEPATPVQQRASRAAAPSPSASAFGTPLADGAPVTASRYADIRVEAARRAEAASSARGVPGGLSVRTRAEPSPPAAGPAAAAGGGRPSAPASSAPPVAMAGSEKYRYRPETPIL